MDISYKVHGHRLVFKAEGEIGMFTVSKFNTVFAQALQETGAYAVVIDLSDVHLMDSCGLGALASAYKLIQANNGYIFLCGLRAGVMELLYITKMERCFKLFRTLQEALAAPDPETIQPQALEGQEVAVQPSLKPAPVH
jgi:anti-anti-sigma factor